MFVTLFVPRKELIMTERTKKKYLEHYELRQVKEPVQPGMYYVVTHYVPRENNSYLVVGRKKYFQTLEEAQKYKEAKEAKIKHR